MTLTLDHAMIEFADISERDVTKAELFSAKMLGKLLAASKDVGI